MSATTGRLPLVDARAVAAELVGLLADVCERIEIAGSIRRERPDIGDVDLVCIPRIEPVSDLFGEPTGRAIDFLDARCNELLASSSLGQRFDKNGRPSWGARLKRARYRGLNVDLRACPDPGTWGAWLLISTGPAAWNKALVTPRSQGGRLPPGFEWRSGFQLYRFGGRVETPEEADVFEALGMSFVEPRERRGGRTKSTRRSLPRWPT